MQAQLDGSTGLTYREAVNNADEVFLPECKWVVAASMMKPSQLDAIIDWFDRFTVTFRAAAPADQRNYQLKIEHTHRVRRNIEQLCASLAMSPAERSLASAIAICHDVGRFPQYRDFGSFRDAATVNHAALSVKVLTDEGVTNALDTKCRRHLLQAVALHNRFTLPLELEPELCRYARLIRDADKLDIWRVFCEYFTVAPEERASAVAWGLPETGFCSAEALRELAAGRLLSNDRLQTADDFKLLQLSWVYDLNFRESFLLLATQGYLDHLVELLPDQEECCDAVASVRAHVAAQLEQRVDTLD